MNQQPNKQIEDRNERRKGSSLLFIRNMDDDCARQIRALAKLRGMTLARLVEGAMRPEIEAAGLHTMRTG